MSQSSIYGTHLADLESVRWFLLREIEKYGQAYSNKHGEKLYDHVTSRIKSEESMREKLSRKELEETTENALWQITDAIGIRIVSKFIDVHHEAVFCIKSVRESCVEFLFCFHQRHLRAYVSSFHQIHRVISSTGLSESKKLIFCHFTQSHHQSPPQIPVH